MSMANTFFAATAAALVLVVAAARPIGAQPVPTVLKTAAGQPIEGWPASLYREMEGASWFRDVAISSISRSAPTYARWLSTHRPAT